MDGVKRKYVLGRIGEVAKEAGYALIQRPGGVYVVRRKMHLAGFVRAPVDVEGADEVTDDQVSAFAQERFAKARDVAEAIVDSGEPVPAENRT